VDPILAGLIPILLAAGAAVIGFGFLRGDRRTQAWKNAAASCGLQVMEVSSLSGLKARSGRLEVRIEPTRTVAVIPGPPDFLAVRIRSELMLTFEWARETVVGDEAFDKRFSLEGPKGLIFALLDAEARRLLLSLDSQCRVEIAGGTLHAEVADGGGPNILPLLVDLGRRLAQSMEGAIPRRLAENARRDPAAGVRLQNLLLLTREHPEDPVTAEALRTSCSDVNPEIRLRAAKELGAEGRGVLLKLAESAGNDAVSAQAVSLLDEELPAERVTAILDRALRGHRMQTARVCVEALGREGDAAAVEPLAKALAREKGELAAAAAQALGAIGSADAEPPLIQALQYEDAEVRTAAASALGRVGSAAAVLPLKEVAEHSLLDRDLRRAARQAIAEIQSRLPGATPGQLSLAGSEAGQLSLAQAEGQLSLAAEAGQLSLPAEEAGKLSIGDEEEGLKTALEGE
jgi:HEAT repeats